MSELRLELPVELRPATPDDLPGLTRVYLESAVFHQALDPERYLVPSVAQVEARYKRAFAANDPASTILLAELHREVVGLVEVALTHSPDLMHRAITFCHIAEIAVATAHQGRGMGAQLLQAAEDWGASNGAELSSLDYNAKNDRAARFYQTAHYRPASITAIKRLR